ncbi:MAG: outer membrane beta-barrel protein [Chlorobi bacterium]|nr:outer membrane beta-barrel protein [Chlorobiota bacterium]
MLDGQMQKWELSILGTLIINFLTTSNINAQFIISGQVLDKTSNEPLPNTIIKVYDYRDSLNQISLADEFGTFRIPVDYGQYKLTFSFLGYIPETLSLFVDSSIYLGIIYLKPKPEQIQEVKIKIKPSRVLIDRKIYIITDSIRKGTAKTSQLLKKLPGISYNPASQSISVLGSENVLILVDGIPRDPKSILNIPSSQIARIEVITEPTGRYALSGYTAIINIITRRLMRGFEAYAGTFSEFYLRTPPKTKTWTNREPYAQLQATIDRTTFFIYSDITKHFDYYSYYNKIAISTDTIIITNTSSPPTQIQDFHTFEFGVIHDLARPFKLGFMASIDLYNQLDGLNLTSTTPMKDLTLMGSYKENDYLFLAFTEGHINPKWKMTIMPELSISPTSQLIEFYSDSYVSSGHLDNSISFKLIWDNAVHPDSNTQFHFGTVLYHEKSKGIVYFSDTTTFSSNFSSANIFAGYLFPISKWQVKLSLNAGLYRLDKGSLKSELLPDLKIKRSFFDDMFSIKAGYRIKRHIPELTSLHSGYWFSSEFITYLGNTSLKPYYEHNPYVELTFADAISFKPYLKISPNSIAQHFYFDNALNRVISQPINIEKSRTIGLSGYIMLPVSDFLFIMIHGNIYDQALTFNRRQHSSFMQHIHATAYGTLFNGTINPFLQVIYHDFYNMGTNSISKDYISAFLAGIELLFFDDNLSITLMYNLPIRDNDKNLYADFLFASADQFIIYKISSYEDFAFNPKYPYFTVDLYFSFSKGFVHQTTVPEPALKEKEEE